MKDSAIKDEILDEHHIASNQALDEIVIPWTDGKETVFVRKPDNPKNANGKYIWPANSKPILWNIRDIPTDVVLLVEGVKQTLSVASYAPFNYAVRGMNGCWGWKKADLSWAKGKQVVVILDGDRLVNDSVAKAAESLVNTLKVYKAESTVFVKLPLQGTAGIDDQLAKEDPDKRTAFLQRYIDGAQVSGKQIVIKTALEFKPKRRKWLWENMIPEGNLGILAGYEGTAKSTLATDIASQLTRGTLPGDYHGTPCKVLYITAEEDWEYDVLPRLIAAEADLGSIITTFIRHDSGIEEALSLSRDLKEIRQIVLENHVGLIIFDSLLYFLGDNINIDVAKPVNDILIPLVQMGFETRCTSLGILHFNKSIKTGNPLDKISNSKAFTRIARAVLTTAKNDDHFVLSASKLSGAAKPTSKMFVIQPVFLPPQYVDEQGQMISSIRVQWMGESDIDVDEIIRLTSMGEKTGTSEVEKWLREYMDSQGGVDVKRNDILRDAKQEGINHETLRRTKKKMGIEHKRVGLGSGSYMVWYYNDIDLEKMKARVRAEWQL